VYASRFPAFRDEEAVMRNAFVFLSAAFVFVCAGNAIGQEAQLHEQQTVQSRNWEGFKEVDCNWKPGPDDRGETMEFEGGDRITTFPLIQRDRATGKCFMSTSPDDAPEVTPLE
jgi:hypothetical protein